MPCEVTTIAGVRAIVCLRSPRKRRCSVCGTLGAGRLCDYPLEWRPRYGKREIRHTCDKPLCSSCAISPDRYTDHCPDHPRDEPVQASLGL